MEFNINISLKNVNFASYTVTSLSVENVTMHGVPNLTTIPHMSRFVGNDSEDVQMSLHDIGTVVL